MINWELELHNALTRQQELTAELANPKNTSNPTQLKVLGQELSELESLLDLLNRYEQATRKLVEAQELLADAELQEMASADEARYKEESDQLMAKLEERLNPADPNDVKNAIVEVRAGTGGEEAELFAGDLFRMYNRYAEKQGWLVEMDSYQSSELGGVREAIFTVKGRGAFGTLKFESGVHRVQRVPETEKQGRIHTSAASVAVFPEVTAVDLEISPNDLRVDVFRSSGPGGQSVNTTDSAVRLTHIPSGLVVSVQDEKSQLKNKDKALKILRSRLAALEAEKREAEQGTARRAMIGTGDRSEKVRTYNFPQDRVTDHRIKQSWSNLKGILDGDLAPLTEALKTADREARN